MRFLKLAILFIMMCAQIGAGNLVGAEELPRMLASAAGLDYFKQELLPRYIEYAEKNPALEAHQVVVHVNIGLDRPFYSDVRPAQHTDCTLVLCNKYNRLEEDYAPADLTDIGGGMKLRAESAAAFQAMRQAMAEAGLYVTVRSAFRSYDNQEWIYNKSVNSVGREATEKAMARAGHSEHQTGLAVDILQAGFGGSPLSSAQFQDREHFEWLKDNACDYGFILRYPENGWAITGYVFEPWHWRYIGVDTAAFMRDNGVETFEEFRAVTPDCPL